MCHAGACRAQRACPLRPPAAFERGTHTSPNGFNLFGTFQGRRRGDYYTVEHALCLMTGKVTSRPGNGSNTGGGNAQQTRHGERSMGQGAADAVGGGTVAVRRLTRQRSDEVRGWCGCAVM